MPCFVVSQWEQSMTGNHTCKLMKSFILATCAVIMFLDVTLKIGLFCSKIHSSASCYVCKYAWRELLPTPPPPPEKWLPYLPQRGVANSAGKFKKKIIVQFTANCNANELKRYMTGLLDCQLSVQNYEHGIATW